jgi:hypothetical protein
MKHRQRSDVRRRQSAWRAWRGEQRAVEPREFTPGAASFLFHLAIDGTENAGALISMMSPEHDTPIKGRIH